MPIDRQKIRELLKASDGSKASADVLTAIVLAVTDGSQDDLSAVHEERRILNHAKAKAIQPKLATRLAPADMVLLKAECQRRLAQEEQTYEGFDYLCQSVEDCLDAGNFEDVLYALVRVYRKAVGMQPHLQHITR
jgi:hypothetical protein